MERSVMDRLVLARHLFELATQSLKIKNDVGLHSCVNLMQDSVEVFLVATADHVNASIPSKSEFDKYFVQIDKMIDPRELPFKTKLLRLNHIRVSSKHRGILPPRSECEGLAYTVRDFFDQVSTEFLGINFLTATPIDLLQDGEAKSFLSEAKAARDAGDFWGCIVNCRKALYVEIERDYDISQFRPDAPKEISLAAMFGPYSKAPAYAKNDAYIQKYVHNATDFIVLDRDDVERSLLRNGVDPTMFWNVLRLTPAMWRTRDVDKRWIVKRDLDLQDESVLAENVDYVLASTIEMILAIHIKKRSEKSSPSSNFRVTLAREGVPVYTSADRNSEVVGLTSPGVRTMQTRFDIDGVEDGERYWRVSSFALGEGTYLSGYVLQSDLVFDNPAEEMSPEIPDA